LKLKNVFLGTMDYSPYMTVPAALKFRNEIGGEEAIRNYTHNLALQAGEYLAQRYGTEVLQTEEQLGCMVDVRLPVNYPDDPSIGGGFWIDTQLYQYPQVSLSILLEFIHFDTYCIFYVSGVRVSLQTQWSMVGSAFCPNLQRPE
jgi:hypothetical protein